MNSVYEHANDRSAERKVRISDFHADIQVPYFYSQVQRESYKVANYFQSRGYKKGDTVSLIMENRPEYVCVWLGLSRVRFFFKSN